MAASAPKARILLVDDQPSKLLSYEAILSDLGEELVKVGSAREALHHLLMGDFAVILVDVCMPEMDGYELAEMVRRHPRFRKTAIILVSAVYMSDFDRLRGYDSGAVDYVPVPIIPEVLRAKVSVFVDLYRKTEELRQLNEELGRRVADRTAQLEAAAARLRTSEERYRVFVANSTEGICCWDFAQPIPMDLPVERQIEHFYEHGSVSDCNDVMARMCGHEHAADLIGARLSELLPADNPRAASFVDRLVRSGYRVIEAESVELDRQGRPRHLSSNLMAVIDEGRLLRVWGTHVDITQRKQAEQERARLLESERLARGEAERSNRLKDEFLAMLSHEMRTPIGGVMCWVQLIRRKKLSQLELEEALAAIESGVRAQVRLIDDLLDVNRIASGKLGIEKCTLDLTEPLRSAIDLVEPIAQSKNVRMYSDFPAESPLAVEGDASRLQQVFWNLLNNAIKFTPPRGEVRIDLRVEDPEAVIIISDTGRGIRPDALTQVFERFWQADRSITRRHGGLGLGLPISRHLVEHHGGTISAESEGEGRGARFIVRLPLASSLNLQSSAATQVDPSNMSFPELRVLAVDDDPAIREVVVRILSQCGANATAVGGVDEALEAMRQWTPDLLISDIGMPDRDGFSLIREVRAMPQGGRLPAIALTAYNNPQDREFAMTAGYDAYLVKPVEHDKLLKAIQSLINPPEAAADRASHEEQGGLITGSVTE